MNLSEDDISLAYKLILGREASAAEVTHAAKHHTDLPSLRSTFISSEEFTAQYRRMQLQIEAQAKPTLIHLHIPKTAGTSLAEALSAQPSLQPNMTVHDETIGTLTALPRQKRRQLRYIRGHLSMGTGAVFDLPYRYMCLIRKPGPRIFSFFQFIQRTVSHPSHAEIVEKQMSFGDYLEFSIDAVPHRVELDNGQVRHLSGKFNAHSLGQEQSLVSDALCTALSSQTLFGFVEHFDAFAQRLRQEGYLPEDAVIAKANVSPNSEDYQSAIDGLTERQKELFELYTKWDSYLYDVCETLLLPRG